MPTEVEQREFRIWMLTGMVEPPLRHPRMAPTAAGTQSRAGFARASKVVQDSPEFKVSSTGVSSHWPLQWGPG